MRCVLAALAVALRIVVTHGAVNYCGASMCGHSDAHTFCKYRSGPSTTCAGYIEAPLSAEEKTRVLARLNRRRSEVARGWRHWPPAGNMLKLRWIEELSREAQRWADQCRPPRTPEERDVCRDLFSISVGQCVASIVGEAPGLRPESMVDMWFMQSMLYEGNVTSYIPPRIKSYYGDFAQMMWSRTFLVGCGRSRFMAEWRGRLRSVERLVCNFAPRGPVPTRPLWTPAAVASVCPPRSQPDTSHALCDYQNDLSASKSFNDSLSDRDNYLLETVFEIEKNESLELLRSLDELYLTKIAIATIGTPLPTLPLYSALPKSDVLEQSGREDELWKVGNDIEIENNSILSPELLSIEKPMIRTKTQVTKAIIIGRPKPYDINDLNDALLEQNFKNVNDAEDLTRIKEKDFYSEYGLLEAEEDIVNSTTTVEVLGHPVSDDNTTDAKFGNFGITELINTTDSMNGSDSYFINANEETKDSIISNKSVDDYLSDPETVRALQDALDKMERSLASPKPDSSAGKVRRELRNLENVASTKPLGVVTAVSEMKSEVTNVEEGNKSGSKGPMLSMVLKYMPYLRPYENSIVGNVNSDCAAPRRVVPLAVCSFLTSFCIVNLWH